jgi:glycosyltransferase involved in cell wall biosynthesis
VAVDDGSEDGSGEVLERRARSDSRLRVIHQPPSGLVPALNAGLDACTAPYVARMDADDVSHPRRLKLQAELLDRHPEVGVVSCLIRHFPRRRVEEGFRLYEEWLNGLVTPEAIARERFVESPVAHPSAMVRRELLEGVGGYRDQGWPEDYDLWLRLIEGGAVFAKVERLLLFWRERRRRLTRVDPRYSIDRFLQCKAHFLARGPLRDCDRVVLWGAGKTGRRLASHLLARGVTPAAFVDIDPAKVGRRVRGAPVWAVEDLPELLGGSAVVLAAVASRGARRLIRAELERLGLREGHDCWCVA